MLGVLKYLNSMNIMHRDIKIEKNMFKNKENIEIVLVDFGLAENFQKTDLILK